MAAVYVTLIYLGRVPVAVWLGEVLLRGRARQEREGMLARFVVGGLIMLLVQLIPVLGGLLIGIATCLGIGAILLRIQAMRARQLV
jgi:hypothetical protein